MARLTKAQIIKQRMLLEYAVDRVTEQRRQFREWHDEAAAKVYDLAEAIAIADKQLDAANLELYRFRKTYKLGLTIT